MELRGRCHGPSREPTGEGHVTKAHTSSLWLLLACGLAAPLPAQPQEAPAISKLTRPRFSYPTWSPDNTRILYETSVTGNWEIWVMDLQGLANSGGKVTRLTDNDHLDRMPSWSPDGRSVAFVSDRDGDYEVFTMNADGSTQVQLTHDDVPAIHPYWSPDGTRIIYNRVVKGERVYEIRMMNRDGSADTAILSDEELNSYAQISPDGTRVVFDKWVENDENNGEIYVLSLESGALTRLTENTTYDGYPTWHPDGKRIIYASRVGEQFKLFSICADGTDRRQFTFGAGNDARADVSSDGRKIVFNREIDDNINIHVLEMDPAWRSAPCAR
jgi:Tol biopolymer transport system component